MDFDLSDEQRMLVDGAQRYVRKECGVEARRASAESADGFSRARWAAFAELGWLALPVPEDAGGLGGSDVDIALLAEEFGRGLVSEPFIDGAVLAATLVARSAGPLREELLTRIAAGDALLALAHLEPGGRSDYDTPVATRAVRDGDGWRLDGVKHLVIHGAAASHWLVTAALDGQPGFGVFLVPRDSAGVAATAYSLIDGTRAADLRLTGVVLPADALLLDPAQAGSALEEALDRAVAAATAMAIGSMEAVMALTADYLKARVQYGQPLARFQALQHRMSEMFVETDQSRSSLFQALAALESGDPARRRRAVSGAKWLTARAGHFVASQGIQLHGGIGITEEYAIGHHYKAMVVFDKRFGDADFHLERAGGLIPLPL